MREISVHPTPNPNSLKFTVAGTIIIPSGMLAFNSSAQAADNELGRSLFALDGVINVLALPQFLTVTKSPAAEWDDLVDGIKGIISLHLASQYE